MSPLGPITVAILPALIAGFMREEKLPIKTVIAGFFFGALVYGLYEVSPQVAISFAWVAAITSMVYNGPVLFQAIGRI